MCAERISQIREIRRIRAAYLQSDKPERLFNFIE